MGRASDEASTLSHQRGKEGDKEEPYSLCLGSNDAEKERESSLPPQEAVQDLLYYSSFHDMICPRGIKQPCCVEAFN